MIAEKFRQLALGLPEAVESAHMGHPDFRVRNKIFATLVPESLRPGRRGAWGMVKLPPDHQESLILAHPDVFEPCNGAWGRAGATYIRLSAVKPAAARQALATAWRNTAPRSLVRQFDKFSVT